MKGTAAIETAGCFREFAKYASLNVLGMIGLSCYILADTYFISKGLGADGLTALNLAIPVYSFIHGCGLMTGIGGGTKYSIRKSLDDHQEAARVFTHVVMLAAAFAACFVLTGLCFSGQIVTLLGADEQVYHMTNTYLKVILLFSPAFLLNNVLLCFVRNDGAPQLAMAAMLGGSFSNILLDYIFIFPWNMGIFGAVLATGLAPLISMMILSPYFLKKKNRFHLTRCRGNAGRTVSILTCGIPSLITEVSSGIVIIVFNIIILKLQGNMGVAAYGIVANLSLVILSIYTGIAQGIQPIISRNHGIGNHRNVRAILRYALAVMLVFSIVLYIGVFFGAEAISAVFNSERHEMLQKIAVEGLRLYFTACPFAGFNIIISMYFTSTEYPMPGNVISILRGFAIMLPMAFLLSAAAGMTGVWCAFPGTELLVAAAGLLFYVKYKRKA